MHEVRLLVLFCKLVGERFCLYSSLNLANKFAKGKDIEESENVFVLFCFNHTYTIRQKRAFVKRIGKKDSLNFLHNSPAFGCVKHKKFFAFGRCVCVRAVGLRMDIA